MLTCTRTEVELTMRKETSQRLRTMGGALTSASVLTRTRMEVELKTLKETSKQKTVGGTFTSALVPP